MRNFSLKRCLNVLAFSAVLCGMSVSFHSCFNSDDVGGAYYTFVGETVASVLQSEEYSTIFGEFCKALDTTEIMNLLSTYGTFTVFAPIDTAMTGYYRDSIKYMEPNATEFTLEKFLSQRPDRMEVLKEMIYYQIINKASYLTSEFPEDHLAEKNMMSRYINVSFKNLNTTGRITVNDNSDIVLKDKEVHNGVIHGVNKVLVPSKEFMAERLTANPRFSIFAKALYLTKLSEKLLLIRDDSYKQPTVYRTNKGDVVTSTPEERLYWYTALVESNATLYKSLKNRGIELDTSNIDNALAQLKSFAAEVYDAVYPQYASISDVQDENNSFNRFIAYHLFDHMAYENSFVYNVTYSEGFDPVDYIVPMAPNSLIEVRGDNVYERGGVVFNVKNLFGDEKYVRLQNRIFTCQNGMAYEIDDILLYDSEVQENVFHKRLRMDVFALCSELMNINMRPVKMNDDSDKEMWFPSDYFSCLQYDDEKTKVQKPKMSNGSIKYQGEMFYMHGQFDFTLTIPNMPSDTWEVRVGIKHRGNAIAQLYVDNRPVGVPINLSSPAKKYGKVTDPETGEQYDYNPENGWRPEVFIKDESGNKVLDEEATAQIDKDMRNLGWMKAPSSIVQVGGGTVLARSEANSTRFILGQFDFGSNTTHEFRAKWVGSDNVDDNGDCYFGLDYIEFIPKSLIDEEGRD